MANASFHFDVETLAPTYRFVKDMPGRSYGLAIARRLGLSEDVLARADVLLPEAARSLDAILADLEAREEELNEKEAAASAEIARLEAERIKAEEKAASLENRETEVSDREREVEREGRQQARQYLLDARRRVEEALGVARGAKTDTTAKQARRMVEEGVTEEGEALKRLEKQAEKLGWRVKGGGQRAASSEQRATKRSASRKGLKNDDRSALHAERTDAPRDSRSPNPSLEAFNLATESASSDIDLRGRNGDEAEAELILALDGAIAGDLPWLRIIHGKGTGALRARVAEVLQLDPRVKSFRLASPQQGGSGVTIAEFDK
jgi:DNA mismatch repair protein MutS2